MSHRFLSVRLIFGIEFASQRLQMVANVAQVNLKLLFPGWKMQDTTPAALALRIKSDIALYGALIAKKGIKLD